MKIATVAFALVLLYMSITPADADGAHGPVGHLRRVRRYQPVLVHLAHMRPQPTVTNGHFRQPGRLEEAGRMAAAAGSRPRYARAPLDPGSVPGYTIDYAGAGTGLAVGYAEGTSDLFTSGTAEFSDLTTNFAGAKSGEALNYAQHVLSDEVRRRRRKTGYNLRTI